MAKYGGLDLASVVIACLGKLDAQQPPVKEPLPVELVLLGTLGPRIEHYQTYSEVRSNLQQRGYIVGPLLDGRAYCWHPETSTRTPATAYARIIDRRIFKGACVVAGGKAG